MAATAATAQIRVPSTARMTVGDRDATVGARAAEIIAISGNTVTLKLGLHESREGWRYRGSLVTPGESLTMRTDAYAVSGTVLSVSVAAQ